MDNGSKQGGSIPKEILMLIVMISSTSTHASMLVSIATVGTPLSSNNPTSIFNYGVMSLTFLFPSGIMPRINISRVMGWNFHVGTQDMHLTSMLL
jgi:hypothetical protein